MKRLLKFCLATSMLVFLVKMPVAMADNGSELKDKINQDIKNREKTLDDIQDKKSDLNDIKDKQSSISYKVQELESQIQSSNYKIRVKENGIKKKQNEVQTLKENIKNLQHEMDKREKYIAKRVQAIYIHGGKKSYMQMLLNSKDFGDLVSRLYFIRQISKQDNDILEKQKDDKKELEKNQEALETTLKKLNSDLENLKHMKASLNDKKDTQKAYLKQLKDKENQVKTTITTKQQQAEFYKKQEESHRAELKEWESQLLQNTNIPNQIRQFVAPAQKLDRTTNIPAAITIAQIILESGGNLSTLATEAKNLFGIKGEGPAGTFYIDTKEVVGGQTITVKAGFRRYDNYYQSMVDHAKVLQHSRYQYFLKNAGSLNEYAYGIQDGGYSTDPNYANKILTIIRDYGLAKYDIGSF